MQHSLDEVVDKSIVARVGLLLRHPFFGNMATRLKIQDASEWCKTAATDGRHLFYNREFFGGLTTKQVEFVVAHEILHNVFDHMGRNEGRDRQIFNIAADYCVNGQLIRDHIGEQPPEIKIFHDPQHYNKSAEQVYDEIFEKYDEEQLKALGQLLDDHIDWEKEGEGRPAYSKDELKQIRDEIREATMQAANAAGAGNTPANVARMIKELTEPKMNWRELLRQQIQSTIKTDYSFSRPNRKGWHTGAILPGMKFDETIDIAVSLDMSGSITDEMSMDFITELKGIMDEYKDFKLDLWCFDTDIYGYKQFTGDNSDEIMEYECKGGGGTDFEANWNFMKEEGIEPKRFIMFTDGYPCGGWGDEEYCETLFIVHGNDAIIAPFGQTAHYK